MVKSLFHGLLYGMQFTITNFWLLMIFPKFMFLVGFSNRPYILSGMSRCYINLPSTLFSYILQSLSRLVLPVGFADSLRLINGTRSHLFYWVSISNAHFPWIDLVPLRMLQCHVLSVLQFNHLPCCLKIHFMHFSKQRPIFILFLFCLTID